MPRTAGLAAYDRRQSDVLAVTPIVLGPCACQACGAPLTWNGHAWLYAGTEDVHNVATCPQPSALAGRALRARTTTS